MNRSPSPCSRSFASIRLSNSRDRCSSLARSKCTLLHESTSLIRIGVLSAARYNCTLNLGHCSRDPVRSRLRKLAQKECAVNQDYRDMFVSALLVGTHPESRLLLHSVFKKQGWRLHEASDRKRA